MLTSLNRTIRSLKRSPVFFATATISLAVGLGLCTASFLFIDSIQHPHLPYADVDRLYFPLLRFGNQRTPPSLAELQRSLTLLPAIEGIAATSSTRENVSIGGLAENLLVTQSSSGFFDLIGIRARLGRLPTIEEVRTQSAVVVSQDIWHSAFNDAEEIGNARLEVRGRIVSVVGVLPRGANQSFKGDVWQPLASATDLESINESGGLGGLAEFGSSGLVVKVRPHVGTASLDAQLSGVAAALTSKFSGAGSSVAPYAIQLRSIRPRPAHMDNFEILMILIGAGVLAIAATNVAALSLARGLTRRRDIALCIALGASRRAIANEVMAEIAVISTIGAVGGMLVSQALIGALTHIVPAELAARWYVVPEFSVRLFGFAAAALVSAIAIAGSLPAWRASRVDPSDPLKDSAGATTGRSRREFRALVIGELAVSMVLLMLASLMALSVRNLASYQFGYDARRMLGANVYMPFTKDTTARPSPLEAQLASLERIRSADGVASAATFSGISPADWAMRSEVMGPSDPSMLLRLATLVSPSFFETLRTPILEGRDFLAGDPQQGGAVILSTRAEKQLFPHGGAVGRMVKFGGERSTHWMPVVGIVGDVDVMSRWSARDPNGLQPDPSVFVAMNRTMMDGWGIAIRPRMDDPRLARSLQAILRDALPPRASSRVSPWIEGYQQQIRYADFYARLFGFIATAAMLLGATGLFSVLSYAVSQRMREFAVRSALGATQGDLLKVVITYALELSLAGTAIGALVSFWASAGVSTMLFGVKNTDPVSLIVAELTLLAITTLASLVPAIRATRANPVDVLRSS